MENILRILDVSWKQSQILYFGQLFLEFFQDQAEMFHDPLFYIDQYFLGNFLGPVRDSKGIVCNSTGQVTSGKPYLYQENPDDYITSIFFQNHATSLNSICVEKCPNYEFNVVEINVGSENIAEHHDELICHDIDKFDETISNGQRFDDAIIAGECMKFIIPTIPFNNRCFPDVTKVTTI